MLVQKAYNKSKVPLMIYKDKNNILDSNQNERKFRQASLIWVYGRNFVSYINELAARLHNNANRQTSLEIIGS